MRRRRNPSGFVPLPPASPWVPLLGLTTSQTASYGVAMRAGGRAALLVMKFVGLEDDPVLTPIYRGLARDGDAKRLRRREGAAKPKLVASGAATRVGRGVRYSPEVTAITSAAYAFAYGGSVESLVRWLATAQYGDADNPQAVLWACLLLARECYDPAMQDAWEYSSAWGPQIVHATLCGYGPLAAFAAEREASRSVPGGPELVDEAFANPAAAAARLGGRPAYGGSASILAAASLSERLLPRADAIGYQSPTDETIAHVVMTIQSRDTTDTTWWEKTKSGEYDRRLSGAIRAYLPYPTAYDAASRASGG